MKNKFNAGDKVIWICINHTLKCWEISDEEIESVVLYKDKISYFLKNRIGQIPENESYTKEEAIKFLQEKFNDE